jgi:hypothetical protein
MFVGPRISQYVHCQLPLFIVNLPFIQFQQFFNENIN